MVSLMEVLLLLSTLLYICVALEVSKSDDSEKPKITRSGRNYDKYYKSPKNNYGDSGDEEGDNDDEYQPDPNSGHPPPGYNSFKGYGYNYPPFGPNYKGYPIYPTFKGGFKFPSVDTSSLSPDQLMSMMTALNKPEDAKEEEGGFLSKLVSDPKSLTAAALIPVSLVLASFVPVLMNYMMTGVAAPAGPQVITTTANNKEARNLIDVPGNFDRVLENFVEFARSIEGDDCIQKAICRVASGDSAMIGSEYIKRAAGAVVNIVRDDWVETVGVKDLLNGLKDGNCNNVCNSSKMMPRNRK